MQRPSESYKMKQEYGKQQISEAGEWDKNTLERMVRRCSTWVFQPFRNWNCLCWTKSHNIFRLAVQNVTSAWFETGHGTWINDSFMVQVTMQQWQEND
jgi:hypothetical protein